LTIRRFLSSFCLFALLVPAQQTLAQSDIQNFVHPLSLVVTHDLDCIGLAEVKNTYTPSDLAGAIIKCVNKRRFDDASQLFFIYSIYGAYDGLRITDPTARAAMGMLNESIFTKTTAAKRRAFGKYIVDYLNENTAQFKNTCALTVKLGRPSYEPIYMLAHGMRAFQFNGDDLKYSSKTTLLKNLERKGLSALWQQSLTRNKCVALVTASTSVKTTAPRAMLGWGGMATSRRHIGWRLCLRLSIQWAA